MGVMSKIIQTSLRKTTCASIFHPEKTCLQFHGYNLIYLIPGAMKYAGPMALISFLMKLKRCNKDLIKETATHFVHFSLALYLVGNTILLTICLFRNMLGRFVTITTGFLPAFLSAFWLFLLSKRLLRFCTLSIFQCLIEAVLKNKVNPISRIVSSSRWLQTIIFMGCSSTVLGAIAKHNYKMFWFVTPPPSEIPKNTKKTVVKCKHENSCRHYVLNGIRYYSLLAFALENIKVVFKKFGKVKSFSTYFKSLDWSAMAFLVSYVGVYRVSYCLMNNYTELNNEIVHPLSAFFGGVSYMFYPKPMLFAYAISLVGEIGWETVKSKRDTFPDILKGIISLPYNKVFFPVVLGLIVHHFVFHNWMLNPIANQFVNAATNNVGDMCLKNAGELMWKYQSSKLS